MRITRTEIAVTTVVLLAAAAWVAFYWVAYGWFAGVAMIAAEAFAVAFPFIMAKLGFSTTPPSPHVTPWPEVERYYTAPCPAISVHNDRCLRTGPHGSIGHLTEDPDRQPHIWQDAYNSEHK